MKALSAERVRRCRARKKAIEQLALLTESCGGEPSQILSDGITHEYDSTDVINNKETTKGLLVQKK